MFGGTIQTVSNFNILRRKTKIKAQNMFYDNYIWVSLLVPASLTLLNVVSTTSLRCGMTPKLHTSKHI